MTNETQGTFYSTTMAVDNYQCPIYVSVFKFIDEFQNIVIDT